MEKIRVVTGHASGEIVEKKSRFLADVFEIHSEEDALGKIDAIRKRYYDARHHCYAFVLGARGVLQRFSDDKEPQGTAGKPILEVLTVQGFTNTLIVVTRYFGGVLLGTGGLVRAYTQAAQKGLAQADLGGNAPEVMQGVPMDVTSDYGFSGKLQYLISQQNIPLLDTVYEASVTFRLVVPVTEAELLTKKITETSNASAIITIGTPSSYIIGPDGPVPYVL